MGPFGLVARRGPPLLLRPATTANVRDTNAQRPDSDPAAHSLVAAPAEKTNRKSKCGSNQVMGVDSVEILTYLDLSHTYGTGPVPAPVPVPEYGRTAVPVGTGPGVPVLVPVLLPVGPVPVPVPAPVPVPVPVPVTGPPVPVKKTRYQSQ